GAIMSGTSRCERNEAGPAEVRGAGEPASNSYDAVPYSSDPFPRTPPDHLAAVASLFGMRPAPIDRCRVLELGCAGGGNLLPMALTLPASRFNGVDLSVALGLRAGNEEGHWGSPSPNRGIQRSSGYLFTILLPARTPRAGGEGHVYPERVNV